MQRVAVVGCSGSGKTTIARRLAGALDVRFVELDDIFHQAEWRDLDPEEFKARVRPLVAKDSWVVDGNYSVVRDIVWERADTVVWFDLPFAVVMARVVRRTLRRVVLRTELWNGNREPWSNLYSLDPQKSIIAWTATRHAACRQRYGAASTDPRWARLEFVRLGTNRDVRALLQRASELVPPRGAR